jgi:outer membrane murein-binding lipoprotein Lpp
MTKRYTLLLISLFLSTLFIAGCSSNKPKVSPQQTQHNAAKNVFNKNTKLAIDIADLEKRLDALQKEVNDTPHGKDRAKLVKKISQIETEIVSLRNKQINNAKEFTNSKHKEENQNNI